MKSLTIVSISRFKLADNRGTPLRVRNILQEIAKRPDIRLITFSWDEAPVIAGSTHIHMDNRHSADIRLIMRTARAEEADVIMGHTLGTWYYLLAAKMLTRSKIVLETHGLVEEESKMYGASSIRYYFEKAAFALTYRACDLIFAISHTLRDVLLRYNKHVSVLYGGCDADTFAHGEATGRYRKEKDSIVIGYAGNSRIWQGLDFLLEAYSRLKEREDGFELSLLISEKKHPQVPEGATVFDALPYQEVPSFFADCDILVIPRPDTPVTHYSFPSKLLEYMATGKPVIASKTSDMHLVINDGVDGLLYEPGETEGFIRRLTSLKDPSRRKEIGENAVRKVREQYSWDHQITLMINDLKNI